MLGVDLFDHRTSCLGVDFFYFDEPTNQLELELWRGGKDEPSLITITNIAPRKDSVPSTRTETQLLEMCPTNKNELN